MTLIIFLISAGTLFVGATDEIKKMLERAEEKVEQMEEEEALEVYREVLEKDPENYEALWNTSLLTTRKYYRLSDEDIQVEGFREALEIAEKLVDQHPDKGHSHYVYAVAKGRYADVEGTTDIIEASHEIKDRIERAAELIPDYAPVWHLYGVWHSDIANVNRAERAAANLVSEGLPESAENDKAEEYLRKAVDMMPENILFRLDLAKHYIEIDEVEKAGEQLKKIAAIEPNIMDDDKLKEEAKELFEEMS
jgi:tetratricopeptide (TPR) repeat protein